jgi:hypothetical protein
LLQCAAHLVDFFGHKVLYSGGCGAIGQLIGRLLDALLGV